MLLQKIAKSVLANHPEVVVMVLLVDERPEEVTDFKMQIGKQAEIFASSNDNPYRRHIEITEQVIDKAKRIVEEKRDVLILFDSLTRMTRAYNNELSSRGRTMSGGIDSRAFQMPRAFFGAARKIEEGGSLTIIGTVLVDTGLADGPDHLRGVQGHRQHGALPLARAGRPARSSPRST